jgi:hypothetical protein
LAHSLTSYDVHRRWEAYVAAKVAAERTRDIRDGIAAGKAWRHFLEAFLEDWAPTPAQTDGG